MPLLPRMTNTAKLRDSGMAIRETNYREDLSRLSEESLEGSEDFSFEERMMIL